MTVTINAQSAIVVNDIQILDASGAAIGSIANVLPGGYITLDTTAENVRTITFSCLDPDGTLAPPDGLLSPDGVEIGVQLGFIIDGEVMLWPQGIYGIQEVDNSTASGSTDSGAGNFPGPGPNLTITAVDRSNRVAINLFTDSFTIPANTLMADAIEQILLSQAPWAVTNITPTDFEVAQQVFSPGDDPWQEIVAIAAAAGMVAYFDNVGILVVRPAPSLAGTAVSVALVDGPTQTAISVTPIYSNNPGYNGCIVTNTSPGVNGGVEIQLSGVAWDTDPQSPTYYLGPYGKRPAPPVQVTTATTNAQCTAMAKALLPQVLGMSNSVVVDNLPIPQLDAYDLIYVSNEATNYEGTLILQQATLYLDYTEAETMTLVPLGTPLIDLSYLKGPSQAQFGSANPYYAGSGQVKYTPYVYTPYAYSSYGSSGASDGSLRSVAGAFGILYVGDRIMRVTRDGLGGSDWESPFTDAEDVEEDL